MTIFDNFYILKYSLKFRDLFFLFNIYSAALLVFKLFTECKTQVPQTQEKRLINGDVVSEYSEGESVAYYAIRIDKN